MFEPVSVIVSLISLGVAWRAYLLAKSGLELQAKSHQLNEVELKTRETPKLQISNETFLSSRQLLALTNNHRYQNESSLHYSAVLSNKGEQVASIESITIDTCPVDSPLEIPTHGLGTLVLGPAYLAAAESMSLECTITSEHFEMVRLFFQKPSAVLVFVLTIKFKGSFGDVLTRRTEIYRMRDIDIIISRGNYHAEKGEPRTYPVTPSDSILA